MNTQRPFKSIGNSLSYSLSTACGLILLAASVSAQQPRPTGPTAPSTPGSVQSPSPTQTTPNPSPTQPNPNTPSTSTPSSTLPGATQNRPGNLGAESPTSNQFSALDTNRDRRISVEEYTGATLAAFKSMDRNRDGRITSAEAAAQPAGSMPSPLTSQIGQLDVNGNWQLTDTESSSNATKMFETLDLNHDGYVSDAELNGRLDPGTDAATNSRDGNPADTNRSR